LILKALRGDEARPGLKLGLAYGCFALAFLIKQHNLAVPAVSSALLLARMVQGRIRLSALMLAHAIALVLVLGYLGFEDTLTAGRMTRTVFGLAGGPFREINYGGWPHLFTISSSIVKRGIGLIITFVACTWIAGRAHEGRSLDRELLLCLLAEVILLVPLCVFNSGAADNYALQAVVLGSVLAGRALDRAWSVDYLPRWGRAAVIGSLLLVLGRESQWVAMTIRARSRERATLQAMLSDPRVSEVPARESYFVEFPQFN